MVDILTHRVIDMINSRDLDDVVLWLKSYPNLQIFSRDGSITYRNAINNAHPVNLQVSDRFHIFKNLTSYAGDLLRKELKKNIHIPSAKGAMQPDSLNQEVISLEAQNRKLTFQEKSEKALQFFSEGKNKSWICKKLNMDIRALNKLLKLTEEERKSFFKTKNSERQLDKKQKKREQVEEVRQLKKSGYNYAEIARMTGLSRQTVKKYTDDNFQIEHASLGVKRGGKLSPYKKEIHELFEKGWRAIDIAEEVCKKGCTATKSTVTHYVADLRKQKKANHDYSETATEIIPRKDILKLLFHPLENVKSLNKEQFEAVCQKHPIVQRVHSLVWEFKAMFKNGNTEELHTWIEKTKQLNLSEINSFIIGIERDIEAVKNAIIYEYNNGLAEGSVNKIKVIKRIMYGRCGFETLKRKVLLLEKMKDFN